MPIPLHDLASPKMALRRWRGRQQRTSDASDDSLGRKVIQATVPDRDAPSAQLLGEITSALLSGDGSSADAVVRALKTRLVAQRPKTVLFALEVADHVLRGVSISNSRPSTASSATHLLNAFNNLLLPRIVSLAKGTPSDKNAPEPTHAISQKAMALLQSWASHTVANGALVRANPKFAEAFRQASSNTPSPPPRATATSSASSAASAGGTTASVPAPTVLSSATAAAAAANSSANGTANGVSANAGGTPVVTSPPPQPPAPNSKVDVPADDVSFVHFLKERVRLFDTLHVINSLPLTDSRILTIRRQLESSMPRLAALVEARQDSASGNSTEVRLYAFIENSLRKFPDYRHQPLSARTRASKNTPNMRRSPRAMQPAPPPYPPPPRHSLEKSQMSTSSQQQGALPSPTPPRPELSPAQEGLLRAICAALGPPPRASSHSNSANPPWLEPPGVELPYDLVHPSTAPQVPHGYDLRMHYPHAAAAAAAVHNAHKTPTMYPAPAQLQHQHSHPYTYNARM